jgi:hypothetical protein
VSDTTGDEGSGRHEAFLALTRLLVGGGLFLTLAAATLMVANIYGESSFLWCSQSLAGPDSEGIHFIDPSLRWLPPEVECRLGVGEGGEATTRVPLPPQVTATFAGLGTAWLLGIGFAGAVLARPERLRLLDRVVSTVGVGSGVSLTLVVLLVWLGRQTAAVQQMPRGFERIVLDGWVSPALVLAVAVGSAITGWRARRHAWLAGVATSTVVFVFLTFTAVVHPVRPLTPTSAVAVGLIGAAGARATRALTGTSS